MTVKFENIVLIQGGSRVCNTQPIPKINPLAAYSLRLAAKKNLLRWMQIKFQTDINMFIQNRPHGGKP